MSSDDGDRNQLDEAPAFIVKHDGVFYVAVAIMSHDPRGEPQSSDHEHTTQQLDDLVKGTAPSPAVAIGPPPPAWTLQQTDRYLKLKIPPPPQPPGSPKRRLPATLEAVLPPIRIEQP